MKVQFYGLASARSRSHSSLGRRLCLTDKLHVRSFGLVLQEYGYYTMEYPCQNSEYRQRRNPCNRL